MTATTTRKTPARAKPAPAKTPAAAARPVATEKGPIEMTDTAKITETVKKAATDATSQAQAAFADINDRTKAAVEKGQKLVEELTEFHKGNVEAFVESAKVAAKGAEEILRYSADYGRKSVEQATANAKTFASAKSPTEVFKLQSDYAKSTFDAAVAESAKFTENYLKLLGNIAQPISNRFAVAAEKFKTAA